MSMISMECPNCGASVKRKKNQYFANCPYCGVEVAFDEIREESKGDVRGQIIRWKRIRNICLSVIGVLCFCAFAFAGAKSNGDILVGIGTVCMILAVTMIITAPIILGGKYPDYDILTDTMDRSAKIKMWAKLMFSSLVIYLLATIAAFTFLGAIGSRR